MAATARPPRHTSAPGAAAATPLSTTPAVIEFERVTKRYDSGDVGITDATFAITPGEFVFIVGASGSGKSTTIRLLIKELEPTSGTIRVAGRDLAAITRKRVPYYRRNVG